MPLTSHRVCKPTLIGCSIQHPISPRRHNASSLGVEYMCAVLKPIVSYFGFGDITTEITIESFGKVNNILYEMVLNDHRSSTLVFSTGSCFNTH